MRLVHVEWVDSHRTPGHWQHYDETLPEPQLLVCRSVGWLTHDGDDCKVIVPHVAQMPDDPMQGCGDMTIPTCAIRSITDITQPDALEPTAA